MAFSVLQLPRIHSPPSSLLVLRVWVSVALTLLRLQDLHQSICSQAELDELHSEASIGTITPPALAVLRAAP